jgi:hypothetical protein
MGMEGRMPSTDLAPVRRARPHRRAAARPAHLVRPTGPDRWEPPTRVEPGQEPAPQTAPLHASARHFGTTAIPAQHHWVIDTLMVLGGIAVLLILFLA